jgi:hypothetical protein
LTEPQLLAYAAGEEALSRSREVTDHVDHCVRCQTLLAEAVRALDEAPPVSSERGLLRTLRTGELLLERYQVLRFVGAGGMGEVYEARDEHLGTTVALKTLALPSLDDRQAVLRLKSEVLLARRATHPNVCRIFDFGVYGRPGAAGAEEIPFLTMELLAGDTLAQRLRAGPLGPAEAASIAAQILTGLGAVHGAGIVHRDLKPENVFLVPEPGQSAPRVVLMDFGLARSALSGASLTASGAVVGTVGYMAPEQLEGRAATPASDLYALGVVLFEMVTGRRPFSGDVSPAVALETAPALPPPWRPAILRCLERGLAERFATVEGVRAALFGAPVRRPRVGRLAALVGVALALGALAWFGARALREPEPLVAPALPQPRPAPAPVVALPATVDEAPPAAPAIDTRRRVVRPRPREVPPAKSVEISAPPAAPPASQPAPPAPRPPPSSRTAEKW